MLRPSLRPLRVALLPLVATLALGTVHCDKLVGLDDFYDCPQDARCPTCTDGKKNGDETDVDCGGACPGKCGGGKVCAADGDCASGMCVDGTCAAPPMTSCTDGKKNGDETDVDCGGSCPDKCADTKGCANGSDCTSKVCTSGTCVPPTCTDNVPNGNETDTDCGGTMCPKCGVGKTCTADGDCAGGVCGTDMKCAATCTDMLKDGDETDVDCGGAMCPKCPETADCSVGGDCETGFCQGGKCVTYYGWAKTYGDQSAQAPSGLAVDTAGSAVIVGGTQGTVDFGGGGLTSAGGSDVFVAKVDKDGNPKWSKIFGDAKDQAATAVATDAAQNVLLTGTFVSSINFGGTALGSGGFPSGSGTAMFLAKLDTNGAHQWSKAFSGLGGLQFRMTPQSLVTDDFLNGGGNIYVAGGFIGTVSFGGSSFTSAGTNAYDVFVASFDKNGNHLASQTFGDAGTQFATSIAYDHQNGSLVIGGWFKGTIDFGNGPLTSTSSKGDVFVARLGAWSKSFPVNDHNDVSPGAGVAVAVDQQGGVYFAGHQYGAATDFGGGPISSSVYLVKYDIQGNHVWSKGFNINFASLGVKTINLALDKGGNVLISDNFSGMADFGGGILDGGQSLNGSFYVAKFDPAGNLLWSRAFGDPSSTHMPSGIGAFGAGTAYISGAYDGQIDFGGGTLASLGQDVFLAKLLLP